MIDIYQKLNINKQSCTILAASKSRSINQIINIFRQGISDFGENYAKEFLQKYEYLKNLSIRWHFIGNLQTNKIKYLYDKIYLFQSIHTIKQLKVLNSFHKPINILIQTKLTTTATHRSGVFLPYLVEFINSAKKFEYINIKGLMYMPTKDENIKTTFKIIKETFEDLKQKFGFSILSMGMSNDYLEAIKFGSNMVRLGRILFEDNNE